MLSKDELLYHYPFRYEDLSKYERGVVTTAKNIYTRSGKSIQKIIVRVGNKTKELTYFNQPYLVKTLRPGINISISGIEYEVNGPLIHTGRLVPIYPETRGVSSKMIRRRIWTKLKTIYVNDWLPEKIIKANCLLDLDTALRQIHFPKKESEANEAKKRLAFDEMLRFQLTAMAKKQAWKRPGAGYKMAVNRQKLTALIKSLPFNLTASQKQALKEILADLKTDFPMNRLLTGEVGSGKTVIAAIAVYLAYLNGLKAVLMAPTEILAQQHYQTLKILPVKIGLVTKSIKETGDILVGTHALLNQKIDRLGLVIIDEQHRFGVRQRAKLLKLKPIPHLLSMTATPIPRSLALTIYAHLDLSQIEPLPGKQTVKTWLVPEAKRPAAYAWIDSQLQAKNQAFIVCPLINPSEKESMKDIKNITDEFKRLQQIFPRRQLNLIHGRLKSAEKNQLLNRFSRGQIDILVATPVIEVGIDVPGAAIMVVENAERFGLAQLHQMRGRIGRRGQTAYCLLFSSQNTRRLKLLTTISSGIKLAEHDLDLRGEGQILGLKQHGYNQFKLADPFDLTLIALTQKAAKAIIASCRPNQKEKFLTAARANAARPLN